MKNLTKLKFLLAAPLLAFTVALTAPTATVAQSKKQENKPFTYVEHMPVFKGGEQELAKFMAGNISYPAEARANGLEGLVVVLFVIDTDGSVKDARVVKKLGRGTDEEALRVVNMTSGKWTPGSQNGLIVPVQFTLPVKFSLSAAERAATADVANQMPQFKGGQEALYNTLSRHLQLPAEARQENLDARIITRFYVEKDGTVSNIRLEETKLKKTVGAGAGMDYMDASTFQVQNKAILARLAEAAINAVKATSGKWAPALKNGQPAGSELVLPIQFSGTASADAKALDAPLMTKYTKAGYTYEEADVKPTFKEGTLERFLAKNLRYPANTTFEGTYKTGIIIMEDGKIIGPMYYIDSDFSEEGFAIHKELRRVFKLMEGKWEPGKVDGKPVTVSKTLIIKFVTNDGTNKAPDTTGTKADVIVTRFK